MLGLGHVTLRTVEKSRKCAVLALEAAASRRSPDALVHAPDAPDAPDTLASGISAKNCGSTVLMVPDSRQKRGCCCGAAVGAEQTERDLSAIVGHRGPRRSHRTGPVRQPTDRCPRAPCKRYAALDYKWRC